MGWFGHSRDEQRTASTPAAREAQALDAYSKSIISVVDTVGPGSRADRRHQGGKRLAVRWRPTGARAPGRVLSSLPMATS